MSRERNTASLYDIIQIPPGDRDNRAWVNDEFVAVITNVQPGQGRKPTKAVLCDPDSPGIRLNAAFFGKGNVAKLAGRKCLFSGQGMTMGEYNGTPEITIGDKATINDMSPVLATTNRLPARVPLKARPLAWR